MKIKHRDKLTGTLFFLPFFIGFVVFYIAPFIVSFGKSFTFGVGRTKFVGLSNYTDVLGSEAFQLASYNTARFIGIGVPLIMLLSTIFALMLQKKFYGSSLFRSIFLLPLVVPVASTVMVIQIIFADNGIINAALAASGISVSSWLHSDRAFAVLVLLYIWKNCGYNMVLVLSGLSAIPNDFYEAADSEGATSFQKFTKITLPIMMPTFFFVFVISIVNSFKSFREAFLIGGDRPHKSIYMLQHFMNNNFANLNYQRLSVAAFILFFVIFMLVFILFQFRRKAGDVEL